MIQKKPTRRTPSPKVSQIKELFEHQRSVKPDSLKSNHVPKTLSSLHKDNFTLVQDCIHSLLLLYPTVPDSPEFQLLSTILREMESSDVPVPILPSLPVKPVGCDPSFYIQCLTKLLH
ncbi:hypothetical protein GEMRC1_009384 [Eukaryota sp. GEM-RC1]